MKLIVCLSSYRRAKRAYLSLENIRDFVDSLLLTQKENIEAGEEEADRLTDRHLIQTVSDIFIGTDGNL